MRIFGSPSTDFDGGKDHINVLTETMAHTKKLPTVAQMHGDRKTSLHYDQNHKFDK